MSIFTLLEIGLIYSNFVNLHTDHGDIAESVSGCFFLNTVHNILITFYVCTECLRRCIETTGIHWRIIVLYVCTVRFFCM